MLDRLKSSKDFSSLSSSSSFCLWKACESVHSQANQFSFRLARPRPFEDYLEQESNQYSMTVQMLSQSNNCFGISTKVIKQANNDVEIKSQLSRAMYTRISLMTKLETAWLFKDVESPNEKLLQKQALC
jgi:hypothetical protein